MPDRLIIRCRRCGHRWDIDMDPESCTCNEDNEWELIVVALGDDPEDPLVTPEMRHLARAISAEFVSLARAIEGWSPLDE